MPSTSPTNLHLRSEDIQDIIEQEPSWLARWGISLVTGLVLSLLVASYFVSYPDRLDLPVAQWHQFPAPGGLVAEVQLPQRNYTDVRPGQSVLLEFDRYPAARYGYLTGRVSQVSSTLNAQGRFTVFVTLSGGGKTTQQHTVVYCPGMTGRASFIIREARLLARVL